MFSVTAAALLVACGGQRTSSPGIEDAGSSDVRGEAQADDATGDVATDSSSGPEAGTCVSGTALGDTAGDGSNGAPQPLEAGACIDGWLTSDPGCPCSISDFSAPCTSVGMRCFIESPGPDLVTVDQLCVNDPSALTPLWVETQIYARDEFAALPNEIVLDTSDCSMRPSQSCSCGTSGTTEGFLGADIQLWPCTYFNPVAYVAFTDGGCASRVRYGASPAPDASYASCLKSVYASRRWDCASSGTHFVMSHTVGPLGGP